MCVDVCAARDRVRPTAGRFAALRRHPLGQSQGFVGRLRRRSRAGSASAFQAQPGGEACVCHLTGPLGLSQPTVSHHLEVLLQAGLVEREQRGSWAYYRVVPEPLAALREVLA
jgi:ArsR family transcriptional regulator, arsenate/arsenite/antimonite-responsive transcriptional repressor